LAIPLSAVNVPLQQVVRVLFSSVIEVNTEVKSMVTIDVMVPRVERTVKVPLISLIIVLRVVNVPLQQVVTVFLISASAVNVELASILIAAIAVKVPLISLLMVLRVVKVPLQQVVTVFLISASAVKVALKSKLIEAIEVNVALQQAANAVNVPLNPLAISGANSAI
jgi:hypothetical protein